MKRIIQQARRLALVAAAFGAVALPLAAHAQTKGDVDRTVLPIQEPAWPTIKELDARKVKPPPRFEVKAPKGAPNVVIVLIDDMGFGQPSTFGGGVAMPTLDRLAQGGLRYNHFHTTALCSPTRAALLTGRNHHSANAGSVMEIATAFPGNAGQIPNSVAPLAEMLRHNGYNTAAFGKWHVTAPWEMSGSGPQDRWPTRQGFEKFYGFLGGETNQWAPLIYDGLLKVEPPHAGQALLHLFRSRRDARPAPRAEGVDREEQGQVRPGLGQVPRGDARAADQARCRAAGHEARPEAAGHQGLGDAVGRREAPLQPPDGGFRGVR
jgi:arylsulfatase